MAQIEVNIDDYLSEEDKRELVIETFKERVKKELFKSSEGTIESDAEVQRVIGNITAQIVMNEVRKYIPDYERKIKENTISSLNKDMSYYVFKKKDVWDREESLAITYMNEAIKECKEGFKSRIKEAIANYDLSKEISEQIGNEFSEMADTIYKLSNLFYSK